MPPAMVAPTITRSTLELMLELIQKRDELPKDIPPALPIRPMSNGRLPSSRVSLPPFVDVCEASMGKDSEIKALNKKENGAEEHGEFAGLPNLESYEDNNCTKIGSMDFAAVSLNETFSDEDIVASVLKKIVIGDETLQRIIGTNESLDDIQAHHNYQKVQNAAIVLQSFIHGERSRHKFQILRKRWVSAVAVQSVIRGCLARRHFMVLKNNGLSKLKHIENLEIHKRMKFSKELPWVHLSVVKELHTRILNAEAGLTQKEQENAILQEQLQKYQIEKTKDTKIDWNETNVQLGSIEVCRANLDSTCTLRKMEKENAALKQQLQQQEKRLLDYEAKMKIAEEIWQKQMESLQTSLDAAMKSIADGVASEVTIHGFPDNKSSGRTLMEEFQQNKQMFEEDVRTLSSPIPPGRPGTNPYKELQKLESQFNSWKKAYKSQLRDAKLAAGSSEPAKWGWGWGCCMRRR